MKYLEIIEHNKELKKTFKCKEYKISVLSNIMVHQLKDILEYNIRTSSINADVEFGDYDNIIQESQKFHESNCVLIFWEIANVLDGFEYKIDTFDEERIESIYQKTIAELTLVFNNLKDTSLVVMNLFSSFAFSSLEIGESNLDLLCKKLNIFLKENKPNHFKLININKTLCEVGLSNSIDFRYYESSKTLYKIDFYKQYAKIISPIILSANGKVKKALIFDCDNTLWKGILGEDGFEGIKIFKDIQYLAKSLAKQGVIIGLCSKNNPEDVDEVLINHPDMILRDEDIVIKMVNWNDKASNLIQIAEDLNIGLDSIVFVDDSDFEINLIKDKVPKITTIQVPKKSYEYINKIREIYSLFYNISKTKEDINKVKMYKEQSTRISSKTIFDDMEDYLCSLELEINLYIDDLSIIPRIAQMSQKTNQFNLTTKRYTESDINTFISSKEYMVFAIGVKDKFGDSGIAGLVILRLDATIAIIDTFLMSCRILGRNIEYKFFEQILYELRLKNIEKLKTTYIRTLKNDQVSDLYAKFGMKCLLESEEKKSYELLVNDFSEKKINYIKVTKNGK